MTGKRGRAGLPLGAPLMPWGFSIAFNPRGRHGTPPLYFTDVGRLSAVAGFVPSYPHNVKHMSRISGSGPIYHSSVTDILLTSAREATGFILSTLTFLRSQKSARKWEAAECLWTPGMGLEPAASHGPVPAHKHPTAFHFLAVMRVVRSIHVPMDPSNG